MNKNTKKSPLEERVEALEAEVSGLQGQLDDEKSKALRALADLQNYQRRETEARSGWSEMAVAEFLQKNLKKFLELQLAVEHTKDPDVAQVITSLFTELEKSGFQRIAPEVGTPLDPDLHEVLMAKEGKPGTVIQVLEPGWKYGNKTLQPAKVAASLQ